MPLFSHLHQKPHIPRQCPWRPVCCMTPLKNCQAGTANHVPTLEVCFSDMLSPLDKWVAAMASPSSHMFQHKACRFPQGLYVEFPLCCPPVHPQLSVASANHTESSVSMRTQTEVLAKHHISVLKEYMVQKAPLSELVKHGVRQALID